MAEQGESLERADGRDSATLRHMSLKRTELHRADGSATWRQEGTEVAAAVFGPFEAPSRKENAERGVVEVLWRTRSGAAGQLEREMESVVRGTVEAAVVSALHPRTLVQVVLQIVSDDGAVLSCAINAACYALVDAGVPMRSLFTSATCSVSEGGILFDPTKEEEESAAAVICFALEAVPAAPEGKPSKAEAKVITSWTSGAFTQEDFFTTLGICRSGQAVIEEFARQALEPYYNRGSK